MNAPDETRTAILDIMAERLRLEDKALEHLRANGRLDDVTAADSILIVELVLALEERFDIRFDPDNIDTDLICDLDRLTTFVSEAQSGS
jgi:acyl carrier protein